MYKASKYFLHLAWLDHCPNVVVDAMACGCTVICSSAGGTKEIAGDNAIIIEENDWNYEPVHLVHRWYKHANLLPYDIECLFKIHARLVQTDKGELYDIKIKEVV